MLHKVFGEITFNVGWQTTRTIVLFGKTFHVNLKIQAYFDEDGITLEQEKAYIDYKNNENNKLQIIESLLKSYSRTADTRFVPKTILFERDGSYALLCDDNDEPDEGIAICLAPTERIVSQDEYL